MASYIQEEKERLQRQLYQLRKDDLLEKMKIEAPLLWWTKKYHINTKGKELSFKDMHYLLSLYKNCSLWTRLSIIKAVQIGLSELAISSSHFEAADGLSVMYILPKYEIRNRFVNNRISRLHRRAAHYAHLSRAAVAEGGSHRTSLMHFGKGGIAYVGSNVEDEFIEIPIDSVYIDEYDRCNQKNLLLVPDRLTASEYRYQREISNPTIEEFGIDERFRQGTQREWMIKCEHCGHLFVPDFFKHVVREVSTNLYAPIDKRYDKDKEGSARLICDKCHRPVDRLKEGEYVAAYSHRDWETVRLSQLYCKYVDLRSLVTEWLSVGANKLKQQVFYNSRLGLAFSAEGAKVLEWMLDNCRRPYRWPLNPSDCRGIKIMGVDVGATLHYVIRERTNDAGLEVRRLVALGEARDFVELGRLLKAWQPKICVIDADPEIHEVASLQKNYKNVYASRFQNGLLTINVNKEKRLITMDRTAALDGVKEGVDTESLLLPMQGKDLYNEMYYSHMQAPTRLLEEGSTLSKVSRFVWTEGSRPDHFFLAEVYCSQADSMIPYRSVFDYYKEESTQLDNEVAKDHDLSTMLQEGDVTRLQALTPEIFSTTISKTYENKEINRDVSGIDKEILSVADSLLETFGKIDIKQFCNSSGLRGEKAFSFLRTHGFVELENLNGVFVRGETDDLPG